MNYSNIDPSLNSNMFTCPHCRNTCIQEWHQYSFSKDNDILIRLKNRNENKYQTEKEKYLCHISRCTTCGEKTFWTHGKMIYPNLRVIDPNPDMPEDVKNIYYEAESILDKSVRCSCGLLRLAIEKLCIHLGSNDKQKLNDQIEFVIEKHKLPQIVKVAFDSIRFIGNKALHDDCIYIKFNTMDTALHLFHFLNIIVEYTISSPKQINDIFLKTKSNNNNSK